MGKPSMNDDIAKYPIYKMHEVDKNKYILIRTEEIKDTNCYNHYEKELHHFISQNMRKTRPKQYAELEHLQKLILMDKDIHHTMPNCTDEQFYNKYGIEKKDLLYNRKWS